MEHEGAVVFRTTGDYGRILEKGSRKWGPEQLIQSFFKFCKWSDPSAETLMEYADVEPPKRLPIDSPISSSLKLKRK